MSGGPHYTQEEDDIIRHALTGQRDVEKTCEYLANTLLPHRNVFTIKSRWYRMIGSNAQTRDYHNPIQDLEELLSPEQKKRVRTNLPVIRRPKT
jgi:hypothetical protein